MADSEDVKGHLLDFATTELSSHANVIIGLAIILFTFLTVVIESKLFIPISLQQCWNISSYKYWLVFVGIVAIIFLIIFDFGRLAFYGAYSHQIIAYPPENIKGLADLREKIEAITKKKFVFHWAKGLISWGSLVSLVGSFIISSLLFWIFFIST